MNHDTLLAYCGLYCGNCIYYQNNAKGIMTDNGDGTYNTCEGCNSSNCSPWCTDCNIKKCSRDKGYRYCIKCSEYPCDLITAFMTDEKYPYHKDITEDMELLEKIGLSAWAEEMDKKYTCKICNTKFSYFDRQCPHCSIL